MPSDTPAEPAPNQAKTPLSICSLACFLLRPPRGLGKGFGLTKDFLVPDVEPEAGFHSFSFKQVELSRDNSQAVDRQTPRSLLG